MQVVGTDIYHDNRHVGSLRSDLWPTLHDAVAEVLEMAQPDMVSEDDHQAALADQEREHDDKVDELNERIRELEKTVARLEDENDTLIAERDAAPEPAPVPVEEPTRKSEFMRLKIVELMAQNAALIAKYEPPAPAPKTRRKK